MIWWPSCSPPGTTAQSTNRSSVCRKGFFTVSHELAAKCVFRRHSRARRPFSATDSSPSDEKFIFLRAFRLGLSENSSKNEKSRGHKRAFRCRVAPVFTANAKMVPNPLPPLGEAKCYVFSSYLYLRIVIFFSFSSFSFSSFSSSLSLLIFLFFSFSSSLPLLSLLGGGRGGRREAGGGGAGGITLITRTPILGYGEQEPQS